MRGTHPDVLADLTGALPAGRPESAARVRTVGNLQGVREGMDREVEGAARNLWIRCESNVHVTTGRSMDPPNEVVETTS